MKADVRLPVCQCLLSSQSDILCGLGSDHKKRHKLTQSQPQTAKAPRHQTKQLNKLELKIPLMSCADKYLKLCYIPNSRECFEVVTMDTETAVSGVTVKGVTQRPLPEKQCRNLSLRPATSPHVALDFNAAGLEELLRSIKDA